MFNWNDSMGFAIRGDIERSEQVKNEAVAMYKNFWDDGIDPNDATDLVFHEIGADLDELTDEDREDMIRQVEKYCNV